MGRFIDIWFWFGAIPGPLSKQTTILLTVLFGAMLIGALASKIMEKRAKGLEKPHKIFQRKIRSILVTMSLLGFLWMFFTYEQARLFSMRFWMLLWLGVTIYWALMIARYAQQVMPAALAAITHQKTAVVYSPSNKRRK